MLGENGATSRRCGIATSALRRPLPLHRLGAHRHARRLALLATARERRWEGGDAGGVAERSPAAAEHLRAWGYDRSWWMSAGVAYPR